MFEAIPSMHLVGVVGGLGAVTGDLLNNAMERAKQLGLAITSTTGGKHAEHSYHYAGCAFDCSGDPAAMRKFYLEMAQLNPTELFYDPMGGIKNGEQIGAIGGHGTHVHLAIAPTAFA
jgi:hypothetical protein